jgi:predicted nucleic acid-binding protein
MRLFVDTSAWLALHDGNDQYHEKAVAQAAKIKNRRIELVTSEYVFDESVTLIRYRVSHRAAVLFGDSLMGSRIVTVADVTGEDRVRAWELFGQYGDKELSYTDCTSFVLMKNFRLQHAYTFDAHFRQMGFDIFT